MQNVPVEATPDLKYEILNLIITFKEEEKRKIIPIPDAWRATVWAKAAEKGS